MGLVLFGVFGVVKPSKTIPSPAVTVAIAPPAPRHEPPVKRGLVSALVVVRTVPESPRRPVAATTAPERGPRTRRHSGRGMAHMRIATNARPESRRRPADSPVGPPERATARPAEQQIILIAARTLTPEEIAAKNEILLIEATPVPLDYRPPRIEQTVSDKL
jgi:hypothetical protein